MVARNRISDTHVACNKTSICLHDIIARCLLSVLQAKADIGNGQPSKQLNIACSVVLIIDKFAAYNLYKNLRHFLKCDTLKG